MWASLKQRMFAFRLERAQCKRSERDFRGVTGKQLPGSPWTCLRRSAKFKPQKTFDFVDVDMCNLYLIICFSSITFSYLSVETDVRNAVSATSVKFDCKTKTRGYDQSDSISAVKHIFLHTHTAGGPACVIQLSRAFPL